MNSKSSEESDRVFDMAAVAAAAAAAAVVVVVLGQLFVSGREEMLRIPIYWSM